MPLDLFRRTRHWAVTSETVRRWRRRRYELFMSLCHVEAHETILDVGAGAGTALECFNRTNPIVAVDLAPQTDGSWLDAPNVTVSVADGTKLPYADGQFPIVFSSSVIHFIPKHLQPVFASEIRRVGQRYFVQTPNKFFPIDPQYQVPFFQLLPRRARKWLNRHFTLGWRQKGHWEDIEPLSATDLRTLFSDAEIHRERLFGLTKSLMAVRR